MKSYREYGITEKYYFEFIHSQEWYDMATWIKGRYNNRCAICKVRGNLDTHHLTYERFGGSERFEDLIVVCRTCHQNIHSDQISQSQVQAAQIKVSLNKDLSAASEQYQETKARMKSEAELTRGNRLKYLKSLLKHRKISKAEYQERIQWVEQNYTTDLARWY